VVVDTGSPTGDCSEKNPRISLSDNTRLLYRVNSRIGRRCSLADVAAV